MFLLNVIPCLINMFKKKEKSGDNNYDVTDACSSYTFTHVVNDMFTYHTIT